MTTKIGSGATPLGGEAAYKSEGVALIRSLNVHDDGFRMGKLARIDDVQAERLAHVTVQTGDVLVNITGASVARCCIVPDGVLPARVNQHVAIVRTVPGRITPAFLHYLLTSADYKNRLLNAGEDGGSTRQAITKAQLEQFVVEFPPLDEQQRIVAVLDEAFAGVAAARANAERNLRNARALFDSQLDRLFTAPGGRTMPIGVVAQVFDGPHATPRTIDEGPIFLGISALQDGRVNLGETRHVTPEDFKTWTRRVRPQAGDVVFSYETRLGQAALIPNGLECCLGRRMGLVRADGTQLDPRYFVYQYLAPPFQRFLASKVVRGATVDRIPVKDFPSFPVVVPSLAEQRRVADLIERLRDECDTLVSVYQRKLAALDELKRSLLHHAFTGQLTASRSKTATPARPARIVSPIERHAGVLAIAHRLHVRRGRARTFGHVKSEKIAHLVESHLGVDLGRRPVKAAAGPNDFPQLLRMEAHARQAGWFDVVGSRNTGYEFRELAGFDAFVEQARADLGERRQKVEHLIELLLPLKSDQAELVTTVYAAWNNRLLDGLDASDESIVRDAREHWHKDKLKFPRDWFFEALTWLREHGVTPSGTGNRVADVPPSDPR